MLHQFSRAELAVGVEGIEVLKNSTVAVLGVGGVGSFTAEALARSGVGRIILLDKDVVDITNINRQIHALLDTVGQEKTELMKERIAKINPHCEAIVLNMFYNEQTFEQLFSAVEQIDYIVDAMDTISSKIHLVKEAKARGIKIISSMGAANKTDPTRFEVTDLFKTSYDPIAKVMRRELRKSGINKGVKVVFSTEIPVKQKVDVLQQVAPNQETPIRKAKMPPSSNAFVPSVAGLIMAGVVINDLLEEANIKIERVNE
ncbi:tRNA threonylcarbamoyladenosine dehydratase [Ammoniphilus oxalaticus]|uniref:tRNA threonylcarbamoyladenosine dehydratase n=1 Tax=Ammoniphilus oxalaticus TaxID=66863 RepID=A0A419SIS4_9BACL|nr:tRNA threonylcarbamoyladenosine dehydratase [Ammoniphilus oxalaticus]RKD23934.1 tRNA threonylcarbamoyladenosine dehydratase [Ammoniphilus oxalaticus]